MNVPGTVTDGFEFPAEFNQLVDPYPLLSRLREHAPAVRVRMASGMDAWLITRYADVRAGLADARFSSDAACASEETRKAMETTLSRTVSMFSGTMVTTDPPEHTRLRTVASRGFSGRSGERLRPCLTAVADRSLAEAISAGDGEIDLARSLVDPLVVAGAGEILGVPEDQRQDVLAEMDAMVTMPIDERAQQAADQAAEALARRFSSLLDSRRAEPDDDLLSVLADAQARGQLSRAEALTTALLIAGSALVNPRGALGCALLALARHPEAIQRLRAEPALIHGAVDELLRYDGPLALGMVRYAAEDVDVCGTVVPAGAQVFMGIGSANRDWRRFEDPDTLDIDRADSAHVAFGNGVHRCLGAAATRALVEAAVEALLRRIPDPELCRPVEALTWHPFVLRSPAEIPIRTAA